MIDRLSPGDHVCWTFDDDQQRLAAVAGYVNAGVRTHQKILYVGDASPGTILTELQDHGVDARNLASTGQLQLGCLEGGYLTGGAFDPERVLDLWRREITVARGSGYAGLRMIGDMGWAGGPVPETDRLYWYEAQANRVFAEGYAMALCLYDRRLFEPRRLSRIQSAHPSTADPATDWKWRPLLRMERTGEPPGLRLIGEADASNREALAITLADVMDDLSGLGAPVTLDLAELRFADAAAARLLMGAATTAPSRVRITGCSLPLVKLLKLLGGEVHEGAVA
ncbi:MEDS domain-containing protein [Sphaerisporangium perillae]|uniref:MEDS domain-containing protein n=1 Tax=Sphaerisporangium perillae TaxID=2935860 RepID=UPI00200EFEE1|nr:MEDS domain-containing protein [Sphaerisporangium perillae]